MQRPGDFIDGAFVSGEEDALIVTRSPADQNDIVGEHIVTRSHIDRAVEAARRALPAWRRTSRQERESLLRRYQEEVRKEEDNFAQLIAREVGKAIWDSRGEAKALAGKVDLMLGEGAELTRDKVLEDLPGAVRYRPQGVVSIIGPFNFPVHLPNGQLVPALLHGNTVVFKPSERTPNAAALLAKCIERAGFPKGVFNLVQGDGPSAARLASHPDIDAVLFTGSVAIGRKILEANLHNPGRMIALELGGKNPSIVLDDADIEWTARQIAFAAFASAGQRCTATSRIFATPGSIGPLSDRLAELAKNLNVGHPLDVTSFMGPMISEGSRAALLEAQGRARAAGYQVIQEGGEFTVEGKPGWYVRPSVHRAPSAQVRVEGYSHDELFGPDVAIYPVSSLEEAIAGANDTRFGLAASIFTKDEAAFEKASDEVRAGVFHWNQSTAGASGRLPFGGVGDSGNQRPAGITAGTLTVWPQAVRFAPPADAPLPSWPGLNAD